MPQILATEPKAIIVRCFRGARKPVGTLLEVTSKEDSALDSGCQSVWSEAAETENGRRFKAAQRVQVPNM